MVELWVSPNLYFYLSGVNKTEGIARSTMETKMFGKFRQLFSNQLDAGRAACQVIQYHKASAQGRQ